MFVLKELLEHYNIDYSNFPKGILKIEVHEDMERLTECIQEEDGIIAFRGKYCKEYPNNKKTLVKSIVEINLTGMTYEEIGIYEKAVDIQDTDPKTYGLKNDDELLDILIRGLNKEFVATIKHVENSFTDFRTYNLFGGLQREN